MPAPLLLDAAGALGFRPEGRPEAAFEDILLLCPARCETAFGVFVRESARRLTCGSNERERARVSKT